MRYSGTLTQWNDERGFGWIEADGGGERLFVHISAFEPRPSAEQRPRSGLRLEFAVGMEQGKKRAQKVAWRAAAQAAPRSSRSAPRAEARGPQGWHASSRFSYGMLWLWLILMLAAALIWSVPRIVWLVYAGLSVLTFMAYWQDKWSAQKGQWRTPEKTLQTMALAGGCRVPCWPSNGCAIKAAKPVFSSSSGAWCCSMWRPCSGSARPMAAMCCVWHRFKDFSSPALD